MSRRFRIPVLVVAVALGALPMLVMAAPAGAVTASVSTVGEFWDAWTDPAVTQIDLENDVQLYTDANYPNGDYTSCGKGGGAYPARTAGDVVLDGRGFTLTMMCSPNAVLVAKGAFGVTVRDVTLTHAGAPNPTAFGNGVVHLGPGTLVVERSTITGNWTSDDCPTSGGVDGGPRCVQGGGGIVAAGPLQVSGTTVTNNRAPGFAGGIYAVGALSIVDSVVAGNRAVDSLQDINIGGGVLSTSFAVVERVELRDNRVGCESGCDAFGGGLAAIQGAEVTASTFTDNRAECDGDCYNIGGAIFATGDLTVSGSTFTGNQATCEDDCAAQGGGIFASGFDPLVQSGAASLGDEVGAAAIAPGAVTITDSSFAGNVASTEAESGACACEGGGLIALDETSVQISRSTFSDNTALFEGGAIAGGSGELVEHMPLTIVDSTITGNTSGVGAVANEDDVTLAYDTITDNILRAIVRSDARTTSRYDAPVDIAANDEEPAAAVATNDTLTSFGTVITGSEGGPSCFVGSDAVSDGWNFADDDSCGFTNVAKGDSEAAGNDPGLGPLAPNGGATRTQLPADLSPLVDAIPITACQTGPAAGVTVDQRGVTRPQMLGCDIGAVEVEAPPVVIQPTFTG